MPDTNRYMGDNLAKISDGEMADMMTEMVLEMMMAEEMKRMDRMDRMDRMEKRVAFLFSIAEDGCGGPNCTGTCKKIAYSFLAKNISREDAHQISEDGCGLPGCGGECKARANLMLEYYNRQSSNE